MLLERFRQPIATQSKLSTVCRRGNPITGLRGIFTSPRGVPGSATRFAGRALLAGFAGLLFSAGHAAAQNTSTWMSDLKPRIGHLQLNQLAIPGTHDTGTYSLDPHSIPSVDSFAFSIQQKADDKLSSADPTGILKSAFDAAFDGIINPLTYNWAVAQDEDILAQLNAGIRYFDIRPCPYPDANTNPVNPDIRICHSLFGAEVTDVLGRVKQFSLSHPDEIIIMDFNHLPGHGITGALSQGFATSIINSFSNVVPNSGDMLISSALISPTSTLAAIWAQPARIIALYDDPNLPATNAGVLWPGQDVKPNSPIGGQAGTAALIVTPSPGTDNVQVQLGADIKYLNCRCDNSNKVASNTLFVLQTNATPSTPMIAGALINQIESSTSVTTVFGTVCALCPPLDALRNAEGWESNTPTGLRDLADQANAAILQMPTAEILSSPSPVTLRQNLNIVQADRFEEEYDANRNVVPSNFANSMIHLDTPPQSTLSIGSPQYSASKQLFVTSATPFTIGATDTYFGVLNIFYDYISGSFDVHRQPSGSSANFTLLAPAADGPYTITSYATNLAGLPEGPNTQPVTLDNTPPVITVTQPAAGFAYPHSSTLTLNYNVTDGSGSGVKSVTPAVLAGPGSVPTLTSGQAINLLTQLPLGSYTFTFGGATDNLGNVRPATTVPFTIIATANSIKADVTQFVGSGAISNANWSTSLSDKLNQAAAFRSAGDCSDAASVYNAFINEVSAQSGKFVKATAAGIMTSDAQYLIAHCP
jgi:hypothetical protein